MLGRPAIDVSHLPETAGVYRIVCVPTGECYVGGSACIRKRVYGHAVTLANGDSKHPALQQAYRQHGGSAFRAEVLDLCELDEVSLRESAWIGKLAPALNVQGHSGRIRAKTRPVATKAKPAREPRTPRAVVARFTHEQRRARRREMAAELFSGATLAHLTAKYGVTAATVRAAASEFYSEFRTVLADQSESVVVDDLRSGKSATDVSIERGVPYSFVLTVARSHGVGLRRGPRPGTAMPSAKVPRSVWESLDWTQRDCVLARQLGVTGERVRQVRKMLGKGKVSRHRQMRLASA